MPNLILMRHAKSSWKIAGQRDHQRPLNKRGQSDAPAMGRRLNDAGWCPDLVLVSDAARTEETWAWMADAFEQPMRVELVSRLYHSGPAEMLAVLKHELRGEETALILAHNPGLEDAVHAWTGEFLTMKTANAVLLEHESPWSVALGRSDWRLSTPILPPSRDTTDV